jgi:predicted nucleic acid-binding protein
MTVLVDSDILIEVSRGKDPAVLSRWMELSTSDAAVLFSPVNVAELWAGARPNEHETLDRLFASLTCVPVDRDVSRQAGVYLRRYRNSHGVELGDALIAATAVAASAVLWTRNRKHYPMKEITFLEG